MGDSVLCSRILSNPSGHSCLIEESSELTYAQLQSSVVATVRAFTSLGLKPADPVIVLLPSNSLLAVVLLALWEVGCAVAPLDPQLSAGELQAIVSDIGPRWIVSADRGGPVSAAVAILDVFGCQLTVDRPTELIYRPKYSPASLVQFSSGTSGRSKMVVRRETSLVLELERYISAVNYGAGDRLLCTSPLHHTYGLMSALLGGLYAGAAVVLSPGLTPARAWRVMTETHTSFLFSVPFFYQLLSRIHPSEKPPVKKYIGGGSPFSEGTAEQFRIVSGRFPTQQYGTTETGALTLNLDSASPYSVGRPLAGVSIRFRTATPPTAQQPAEVEVKTEGMIERYENLHPGEQEDKFVDGWLQTRDLGHWMADGSLALTGRRSDIINVAGSKVDPVEVERVILQHPSVLEAVVLGIPHPMMGQLVKAVVVPRSAVDTAELQQWCAGRLLAHKVPKVWQTVDQLPRNAMGKVLRRLLLSN